MRLTAAVTTSGFSSPTLASPLESAIAIAEGSGLPDELTESCDERVSIPMAGEVESLNVAVAASLALFWAGFRNPVS